MTVATIQSQTETGIVVELQPKGFAYCGMPVAEVEISFDHPLHGRCRVIAKHFATIGKQRGAVGYGFLGCNGERGSAFRSEKYLSNLAVTVPESDFAAALAVASAQAATAVQVAEAEAASEAAEQAATARAECPDGFAPCRQKWSNGDLCAALYVTGDGIEVIDSDLLENHGGFYWIAAALVEAARVKSADETAKAEAQKASRAATLQAATSKAGETGKDVEVERWTEDCDGSVDECSTDIVTRSIRPDGSAIVRRIHTH